MKSAGGTKRKGEVGEGLSFAAHPKPGTSQAGAELVLLWGGDFRQGWEAQQLNELGLQIPLKNVRMNTLP